MTAIITKFDSWWKVLSLLVGAVALGVTMGISASSFFGLPARVQAHALRIEKLESEGGLARAEREKISEGIERLQCMWLADRRESPIEDCL